MARYVLTVVDDAGSRRSVPCRTLGDLVVLAGALPSLGWALVAGGVA